MATGVNFMQPASGDADIFFSGTALRRLVGALAQWGSQGVIAPPSARVAHRAAGANFSVDIGVFDAIVFGDDVANQGAYHIWNDTAALNVATPSAPASGTRVHRLVAQVRDKRSNAGYTTYDWVPSLLQDTGSGTPAEPASSMTLALISIASGQANVADSNITISYPVLRGLALPSVQVSTQNNSGSYNNANLWSTFSSPNWAPIVFTVPASGMVAVTIGGTLTPTGSVIMHLGWQLTGVDSFGFGNRQAVGTSTFMGQASRRTILTGLTPGAVDTITPGWWIGTASSGTDGNDGQLTVEPIA